MSEHVKFCFANLEKIKLINDKMTAELKTKTKSIGVKAVFKYMNQIKKAIADGIADQIDFNIDEEIMPLSQESNDNNIETIVDDIEDMTEAKDDQVVTGMNDAKIDGQDIIRRLDRIEKVVDGLVVIHKKHVTQNNNKFENRSHPGNSPNRIKTCYICHRRGHISYNCWFNPNRRQYSYQGQQPRTYTSQKGYQSNSYNTANESWSNARQWPDNQGYRSAAQHYRPNPRVFNRSYLNQNQNDFLGKANQNKFINQEPFIKWVPETDNQFMRQNPLNAGPSWKTTM